MLRYEFKYALNGLALDQILNTVRLHSAGFSEAYPKRQVNNYYLDTINLDYFYQNIDGVARRRKFRYRWYGESSNIAQAQLEVKHRDNELGWKETFKLDKDLIQTKDKMMQHFNALKLTTLFLVPQLYNCYERYYFESQDKKFRITVDFNQAFGLPFQNNTKYLVTHKDPTQVLELKFDETHLDILDSITTELPYLRTKNSKYSNGIQHVIGMT